MEKETGALLLSGEGNWCTTVLKEKKTDLHYCSWEKGTGSLLLSEEGIWCFTVLWRRAMGLYCTLENGSGAVPSLLVNSDESRQIFLVKFA